MSISLQFDQVLRALANTVGVGMNSTTDPTLEVDKGHLYSKYVDSVNELFYEDGYGTITQVTTDGQLLIDGYNGTVTLGEITGFVIENGLIKSVF
jgi:hypothetical protein